MATQPNLNTKPVQSVATEVQANAPTATKRRRDDLTQFHANSAGLMTSQLLEVQSLYAFEMAKDFALNSNNFFATNSAVGQTLGEAAYHSTMDDATKSMIQGGTTIGAGVISIGGGVISSRAAAKSGAEASKARGKIDNMSSWKSAIKDGAVMGEGEEVLPNAGLQDLDGEAAKLMADKENMPKFDEKAHKNALDQINGNSEYQRKEIKESLQDGIRHQETVAAGHQNDAQRVASTSQMYSQGLSQIVQGAGTIASSFPDRDKAKQERARAALQPVSSQSGQMASASQQKMSELQNAAAEQLRNLRQVRDAAQNIRG